MEHKSSEVLWITTPCSLVGRYQRFDCFEKFKSENVCNIFIRNVSNGLLDNAVQMSVILKKEKACFSETLATTYGLHGVRYLYSEDVGSVLFETVVTV